MQNWALGACPWTPPAAMAETRRRSRKELPASDFSKVLLRSRTSVLLRARLRALRIYYGVHSYRSYGDSTT